MLVANKNSAKRPNCIGLRENLFLFQTRCLNVYNFTLSERRSPRSAHCFLVWSLPAVMLLCFCSSNASGVISDGWRAAAELFVRFILEALRVFALKTNFVDIGVIFSYKHLIYQASLWLCVYNCLLSLQCLPIVGYHGCRPRVWNWVRGRWQGSAFDWLPCSLWPKLFRYNWGKVKTR